MPVLPYQLLGNLPQSVASHGVKPKLGKTRLNSAIAQKTHVPTRGIDNRLQLGGPRSRFIGKSASGAGSITQTNPFGSIFSAVNGLLQNNSPPSMRTTVPPVPMASEPLPPTDSAAVMRDFNARFPSSAPPIAAPTSGAGKAFRGSLDRIMRASGVSPAGEPNQAVKVGPFGDLNTPLAKPPFNGPFSSTGTAPAAYSQPVGDLPAMPPNAFQQGKAPIEPATPSGPLFGPPTSPGDSPWAGTVPSRASLEKRIRAGRPAGPVAAGMSRPSEERVRSAFDDEAEKYVGPTRARLARDIKASRPVDPVVAEAEMRGKVSLLRRRVAEAMASKRGAAYRPIEKDFLSRLKDYKGGSGIAADPSMAMSRSGLLGGGKRGSMRPPGALNPTYRDPRFPDGSAATGERIEAGIAGGMTLPFKPAREGSLENQRTSLKRIMAGFKYKDLDRRSHEERQSAIQNAKATRQRFLPTEEEKVATYKSRLASRRLRSQNVIDRAEAKAEDRRDRLRARAEGPTPLSRALAGMSPAQRGRFINQQQIGKLEWEKLRQQGGLNEATIAKLRGEADVSDATARTLTDKLTGNTVDATSPDMDAIGGVYTKPVKPLSKLILPSLGSIAPSTTAEAKVANEESDAYKIGQTGVLGVKHKSGFYKTLDALADKLVNGEITTDKERSAIKIVLKDMKPEDSAIGRTWRKTKGWLPYYLMRKVLPGFENNRKGLHGAVMSNDWEKAIEIAKEGRSLREMPEALRP